MKELIISIFGPELGSLWKIKNKTWKSGFASKNDPEGCHPGLVISEAQSKFTYQTAPGTKKPHFKESNIFRVKLDPINRPDLESNFLLYLAEAIHKKEFLKFESGWWGKFILDEDDLERLLELVEP